VVRGPKISEVGEAKVVVVGSTERGGGSGDVVLEKRDLQSGDWDVVWEEGEFGGVGRHV